MKLIAMFVVLAVARPAAADGKIVLESFTGGKTDDGDRAVAPLLRALANQGFVGGDTLRARFEERGSRPAIGKPLPANFAERLEAGQRAWFEGKDEEAINTITPLVVDALASPGVFAQNQDARGALEPALFVLAMSEHRRNNGAMAKRWIGELLRSFPTTAPPRAKYGADAVKAFEDIKKELTAGAPGTLEVKSNFNGAVVFIDGKYEGSNAVKKDKLVAGEYRVFATFGGQLSRVHVVTVKPGETVTLAINAAFDAAVQTSPTWTGLAYTNAADRERYEMTHAASFGNALDAEAVAVVGIEDVHGKPAIVGSLVNRQAATEIRRASVALDPAPSPDQLKSLAEYIAGENLKPEGIEVLPIDKTVLRPEGPDGPIGAGPERPSGGRWGGWKWVAGGVAIAALATGGVLVKLDGTCPDKVTPPDPCPNLYNTGVPGYLVLGAGVGAGVLSVYLFVHKDAATTRTAYVVPARGGAIAGFTTRF